MSDKALRKKGRSSKEARHVRLYHAMMKTEAWRSLTGSIGNVARSAYVEIASRYGGPGSNNGSIPYAAREMGDALGVSKATAWRAMQLLQDRGFTVEMKRGSFSHKLKHATEWRLTEFPCDVTGQLPTREYQRWTKQNAVAPVKPNGASRETVRFHP